MRLLTGLLALALCLATTATAPSPSAAQACLPLDDHALLAQLIGAPLREPAPAQAQVEQLARDAGTVVLLGDAITSGPQVSGLIDRLDAAAGPQAPPLIAVDEEGGRVARFGRAGVTTHLPSARAMAAASSPDEVRDLARGLGGELDALGVDWDLAPVLDLTDAAADTVIGDRSFSADPVLAGAYGSAFAAGLQDAGIRTAGKHFPDHGLTTTDTHRAPATVDVDPATLDQRHLAPYRHARPHLDAVMLSHLIVPAIDPTTPASFSAPMVQLLRRSVGVDGRPYDGVVVTDDLSMQAVAAVADQPTAAVRAIQAGVDHVLAGSPEAAAAVHARLREALTSGELDRERIREAARRVLRMKDVEGAAASCLLGLPPVEGAAAVTDSGPRSWIVEDGRRRAIPDPETAAAHRAAPVRYSDEEVAGLPEGAPLTSVRRFQPAVVAEPGADAQGVAVARAVTEHGTGAAARLVVLADAPAWGVAVAAQAAVLADGPGTSPTGRSSGVGVVVPGAVAAGLVDLLAAPDAAVIAVGDGPVEPGARPFNRLPAADPIGAALTTLADRDAQIGPAVVLVVAAPDAPALATLAPLVAAGRIGLLLSDGDLDPRVAARAQQHEGPVHTLGLPQAASQTLAADALPQDVAGLADWAHRTLELRGDLLIHDGDDQLAAALPLAASAAAVAIPSAGPPQPALASVVAGWWLPASDPRTAFLAGVAPHGWAGIGQPTYYRRS